MLSESCRVDRSVVDALRPGGPGVDGVGTVHLLATGA